MSETKINFKFKKEQNIYCLTVDKETIPLFPKHVEQIKPFVKSKSYTGQTPLLNWFEKEFPTFYKNNNIASKGLSILKILQESSDFPK